MALSTKIYFAYSSLYMHRDLIVIIFLSFFVFGCDKGTNCCSKKSQDDGTPKTAQNIVSIPADAPESILTIQKIAYALEKYKVDHRSYPISNPDGGTPGQWDGAITSDRTVKKNWIPGLIPSYLDSLPTDEHPGRPELAKYIYKSDGANYLLLVRNSADCNWVRAHDVKMLYNDQCHAFGVWTRFARRH